MTDREVMKMALAKLEHLWEIGIDAEYKVELLPEIRVLRQALAQPDKPLRLSPVYEYGHIHDASQPEQESGKCGCGANLYINEDGKPCSKVFAQPEREWVGLTDEECRRFNNRLSGSGVAEEIEANLKEKNSAL